MTDHRVWHASRDAYHCAFRMIRLLLEDGRSMDLEKLRVLDMFLLYPPLLHRASMPSDIKKAFRELKIPRPENVFLQLPSAAAIFQDLRLYQNSAVAQLTARALISVTDLKQGLLSLTIDALPDDLIARARQRNASDGGVSNFLVSAYSKQPLRGAASIYRKAGLPARGFSA